MKTLMHSVLITVTVFCLSVLASAQTPDDLVIVSYKDVMTIQEAQASGYFEHNGRWLKKKWKKKVKKWKRLDREHSDWDDANRFATKHYRVLSNLPSDILDSEISPFLDAQFKAYTKFFKREFGMSSKAANKKLIHVHKSIEDYAVNNGRTVQRARYNPGFIAGGSKLVVYYDVRNPEVFFSTVMHEGAHQFVMAIFPGAEFPKWIHEGLATYFEGCRYSRSEKKFELGDLPMSRLGTARRALREKPNASIADLFLKVPDPKFGAEQYSLAWSFIYYLVHGEKGKYKKAFVKFLKEMNGAGVKRTPDQIFKSIAKVNFVDLEQGWKKYITSLKTKDLPWWVCLRGNNEKMAELGFQARDRVTHLNGTRIINAKHFNELWAKRNTKLPTNIIVRADAREASKLRGIRLPAECDCDLEGYNTRSRSGALKD